MRRQARLFAIVEYLRGRRTGVTAEALAERFEVTVRTIYRDLDALREGSLPVAADRGPGGGYALDRSYALPPVNFSAREAAVLVTVGRWATELRLLPFADTLASGLDKVRGALSTSAQRELLGLCDELTFTGVPALPTPPDVRAAFERAWFERRPLAIEYRKANGELTSRTVRLVTLVLERSGTLLNVLDLAKGEGRQLRLDRVESATIVAAGVEAGVAGGVEAVEPGARATARRRRLERRPARSRA
ncbi:MAG TPA: HTH domain-containing protein [Polyangiaceae bacterium]|nr:HTH domain-containing protein [Polyangiaceae bacterium]